VRLVLLTTTTRNSYRLDYSLPLAALMSGKRRQHEAMKANDDDKDAESAREAESSSCRRPDGCRGAASAAGAVAAEVSRKEEKMKKGEGQEQTLLLPSPRPPASRGERSEQRLLAGGRDAGAESLLAWANGMLDEALVSLEEPDFANAVLFCRLADRLLFERCSFPFEALVVVADPSQDLLHSLSCPALGGASVDSGFGAQLRETRLKFLRCHNFLQLQAGPPLRESDVGRFKL
jgi:hypothetical protein